MRNSIFAKSRTVVIELLSCPRYRSQTAVIPSSSYSSSPYFRKLVWKGTDTTESLISRQFLDNRKFGYRNSEESRVLHRYPFSPVRTMVTDSKDMQTQKQKEDKKLIDDATTERVPEKEPEGQGQGTENLEKQKTESGSSAGESKTLSTGERLKLAVRDYGGTVLVFHITISLMSLGSCYLLVSSGLDIIGLLTRLGVSESLLESKITQGGSTFVLAYAIHKVFAPVRLGITLTTVPFIVKKLRKMGILKTPV